MSEVTYETTGLIYVDTFYKPDNVKDVAFICEKFTYSAKCFNDKIQFIRAQRNEEMMHDGTYATFEECQQKDVWREKFNGNHQPLQNWIDNLP